MGISAQVKRAYIDLMIEGIPHPKEYAELMAKFAHDTLAELMKAEWIHFHSIRCPYNCKDDRHGWTDIQWQEAANEALTNVSAEGKARQNEGVKEKADG